MQGGRDDRVLYDGLVQWSDSIGVMYIQVAMSTAHRRSLPLHLPAVLLRQLMSPVYH